MNAAETKSAMDESKRYQKNATYVPSVITPSTFVTFIWDNCDHNCESIFDDTLHCMNGIIVQRKEISSYARVELTHEAVSAIENTTNTSIETFRKERDDYYVSKTKRVELEDVQIEGSCSSKRENQLYQLLRYPSSLKGEEQAVPV